MLNNNNDMNIAVDLKDGIEDPDYFCYFDGDRRNLYKFNKNSANYKRILETIAYFKSQGYEPEIISKKKDPVKRRRKRKRRF